MHHRRSPMGDRRIEGIRWVIIKITFNALTI